MKTIVRDNEVIDIIREWDAKYYINKLMEYGYSVSLPQIESNNPLTFNNIKILSVEEIKPLIDSAREEFTKPTIAVFENKVVLTYGKTNKILPPSIPPPEPLINEPYTSISGKYYDESKVIERKQYENQYMILTKQIMQLAGITVEDDVWNKLEDKDYQEIGLGACVNNPGVGNFLVTSLAYIHRTLKTDFEWKWEDIEFRPEVIT